MALFMKREFTWAEGAGRSSIRFTIKIAPVAGESAATTTRRFKQEAARLAQAFVEDIHGIKLLRNSAEVWRWSKGDDPIQRAE